jgi:Bacterial Ig-like domain/Secretion system C-terminal sorting domain
VANFYKQPTMFHNYTTKGLLLIAICLITQLSGAQTLLHYWNFNDSTSPTTLFTPTTSTVGTSSINLIAGGTSALEIPGDGQAFDVQNLNAQGTDPAGTHLRFNNPIGGAIVFALPTTGYQDIEVKFASRRSGQGAGNQLWSYSTDGTNFTALTTINPNNGNPGLYTLDLSAIAAADNNPNFKLKVEFAQGAGGVEGNNRFDNFTARGTAMPVLIHYWNFNAGTTIPEVLTVTESIVGGSAIAAIAGGTSAIEVPGTGQNFNVLNLNAQNGDPSGNHLRFNNPIGGALVFTIPTTGYENIIVRFATRRSPQGADDQLWSYSTDGTNFTSFTTIHPVSGDPTLATLDLSAITAASNNANFKIKVEFAQGAGGVEGNNRFDNFTVHAEAMEGTTDTTPPMVVFAPAGGETNVATSIHPTLTFNEPVRMMNDLALNDTNVDVFVELRLNNATGALVPFDATISGNTITIVPTTPLLNGQQYYVAILDNAVEDMSNNAITATLFATFTTIATQSAIGTGDMVFTGYRMNATGAEDQVALLTFVDIAPGTFINLTDSKYTTNAQPQCPNGIVWTATNCVPAGSVITIQTEALVANTGTVTGSGFGLSSSGDQVIVYTGTAAAPNYITALSSNGWVAANTTCNGSASMIPAGLADGTSALNTSTAPGNVTGNTVNAFYSGTQTGAPAALSTAILNPANWTGVAAGTAPQTWPTWAFPSSPNVQSATVVNNTTIQLVFNNELDAISAAAIANYTGIAGLSTVTVSGNTVTLAYTTPFASGTGYTLTVNNIEDENGLTMACAYTFTFDYNMTIAFADDFVVVNEDAGTLDFALNLTSPSPGTVNLVVKAAPFSTADSDDFTLATQPLTFTGTSPLTRTISIPIIDDTEEEQQAEYFVLTLEDAAGLTITGETLATIYIKDNDTAAPAPNQDIQLEYVTSFDPSGVNDSTCEIVVYDPASKRLFATSAVEGRFDIINFANPEAPVTISSIDMTTYGGVTSVAVKNGIVAVASPNAQEHLDGSVVFFDTNGVFLSQVGVGALPDNISFTPDGTKVLTANEGQPNSDYSTDPEGSVSIIDVSGNVAELTDEDVTTLLFTDYNSQEAALIASGVRKLKVTSTMSRDFEPEYISTSANSEKAWVTLQENNAIAEINLTNNTITDVWALGTKDMSLPGNGFDISDNNNEVLIANWPIRSYFIPDGVATYSVGTTNYIITANEGDEKEYDGFEERTTIGAGSYLLDAASYPQTAMLKKAHNAGRMRVTKLNGNTDADAEYEQIYSVGTRSFSIFNADTQEIVYDSGDDFEMYTSSAFPTLFNADSEGSNTPKSRSRAKGPEPEGVTVAQIMGKTFAFVTLERIGGVMVYDVTDPNNVQFVDYKNSRSTSAYEGDHGPEGIIYINSTDSPDTKPYVVVANEISGTISVFEVNTENLGTGEFGNGPKAFVIFPNPSAGGIAYFNRAADIEVYDYSGKLILSEKQALTIDTSRMASGIYLVKTSEGITKKLLVN